MDFSGFHDYCVIIAPPCMIRQDLANWIYILEESDIWGLNRFDQVICMKLIKKVNSVNRIKETRCSEYSGQRTILQSCWNTSGWLFHSTLSQKEMFEIFALEVLTIKFRWNVPSRIASMTCNCFFWQVKFFFKNWRRKNYLKNKHN